jgi:DNA mismatch repair ATPase MutS
MLFLMDANALYFAVRELQVHARHLLKVIETVGDIDAAIAVASFREGADGWTRPRFVAPDKGAAFSDPPDPLVDEAVPNSIALAPPHGVLVTGSNMSGKSTFLRTVGVNVVLAQSINTCLARGYEAPIYQIRSCIGRADDLIAGKSYYLVEVESVLALVKASEQLEPQLFIFDELFRGTNAVERIAAGEAVLHALVSQGKPHVVLTATHDVELVDLLRESYAVYHLGDAVGPDGLVFDYRLTPGPATSRNAIALLKLNGAPEPHARSRARPSSIVSGRQPVAEGRGYLIRTRAAGAVLGAGNRWALCAGDG